MDLKRILRTIAVAAAVLSAGATAQPTISSFAPASGPIGTSVTISGTSFNASDSEDIVFFGAVKGSVSSATTSSLTVSVPLGATYSQISVTDAATGLTAYTNAPFVVTFYSVRAIDATSLAPRVDFTAGPGPQSIDVSDIDGDGKLDAATANYPNTVSVFRNVATAGSISSSSFSTKVDISTGPNAISVAIRDLDGDGKPDLLTTTNDDSTFSIYRNTSTEGSITASSFASKVDIRTGTNPRGVVIGDLDGDGKPDVIVINNSSNTLSILRNTATPGSITTGSFASRFDLATGTGANFYSAAVCDIDGDGKPDLLFTISTDSTLVVLRNTSVPGAISFAPKLFFAVGVSPTDVAAGDLDGDGKPDVAVTNSADNDCCVLQNLSTPSSISFAPRVNFETGSNPRNIAFGDLDGDGRPDMAVVNNNGPSVSILRNTSSPGSISFSQKVDFATGNGPYGIAIGDIDGDGLPDVLTPNYSGKMSVFRNLIAVFTSVPTAPTFFSPASGAINQTTSLTLSWERPLQAMGYHVQCGTDSTFASGIVVDDSTLVDTFKVISNLSVSTKYFWRIGSWNTIGPGPFSAIGNFVTVVPPPATVTSTPGNTCIALDWPASVAPNVLRYRLYRGTSSSATTLIDSTSGTHLVDSNLTNGTRYYYRLTAVNDFSVEGPFSVEVSTRPFTYPELLLPADGATNLPTSPTLVWHQSPGASFYRVECSTDSTFETGIVVNDSTLVDTTRTLSGLSVSTRHFWRVSAREAGVSTPFTSVRSFVTVVPAPGSLTPTPGNRRVTLDWAPSPATNIQQYRVYRSTSSPASALIGATVGTHYVDSNLTNGTHYYYRLSTVNDLSVEGPFGDEVVAMPFNTPPHASALSDIYQPNSGTVLSSITFSSQGSYDPDGTIDSVFWFVNGSFSGAETQLTHAYGQGTNTVMLVVQDNQGARDTSTATVSRSMFKFFLGGGVYAGPSLLGNNILYVIGTGDAVYRLDSSGNDLYSLQVGGEVRSSSSIAYDTTVYIASSDKNLYAFSKLGISLWPALPLGGTLTSTPAVDSITNRVYIGVSNKNFFAVNRTTGVVAWNYFVDAPIAGSAAITLDRKLVFSTVRGTVYGFDLNVVSSSPNPSWQLSLSDSIFGSPAIDEEGSVYYGTSSGKVVKASLPVAQQASTLWQTQTGGGIVGSPVIDGYGTLYVGSLDGKLYALNTQSGNIKWTYESGSPILSTPAVSDAGVIYFGNHGGRVFALDTNSILQWNYQDSTSVDAPLLYHSGVLYVGTTGGRLIAFHDNADSSAHAVPNLSAFTKRTESTSLPVWGTFQGNNQRTGLPRGRTILRVGDPKSQIPKDFILSQNYPNPFNPSTTVQYGIPLASHVSLRIYNLLGQVVADLVDGQQEAGWYQLEWNAHASSGIYFYRMEAVQTSNPNNRFVQVKRMLLLR